MCNNQHHFQRFSKKNHITPKHQWITVENIAAPQPHHATYGNKLADVTVIIVHAAVIEYTTQIEVNNT